MISLAANQATKLASKAGPVAVKLPARRTFLTAVDQFESALQFKSGRFVGFKEPGIRLNVPVVNELRRVDMRVQTLAIPAQELMTQDNVTINVDGVAFFKVSDAKKALLQIVDYKKAVSEAAQTCLRGQLSRNTFDDLLRDRKEAAKTVLEALQATCGAWGIQVDAVKLKNIKIDPTMVRAMGRRAEAERLREARMIEADAEAKASQKLSDAAAVFAQAPIALRLRELQTYAQIAAEGNTVLIPANLSHDVQHSLTALRQAVERREADRKSSSDAAPRG